MDIEIQNWLIVLNLIVTTIITWLLYTKSKKETRKNLLNSQLLELQRLSFENPFLENEEYTKQWNILREKYIDKKYNEFDVKEFLKYDVYTEMIFNFIEISLEIYTTEKELLNYVDFKSWVRTHSLCWRNPLKEHSNRDVYSEKMCNFIDKWLK